MPFKPIHADTICYSAFELAFALLLHGESCNERCILLTLLLQNIIYAAACITSNYMHLDEAKLPFQVILGGVIMSLLLSLANRKQQTKLQHPHHSKRSEPCTKLNYSVRRIKTHLHQ